MINLEDCGDPQSIRVLKPQESIRIVPYREEADPVSRLDRFSECEELRRMLLYIGPLTKRYKDPYKVDHGHGISYVRDPLKVDVKQAQRARNLKSFIACKTITQAERENAKKRLQELFSGVADGTGQDISFLEIDRKKLFVENMDTLASGYCAWDLSLDRSDYLVVFVSNEEEADSWFDECLSLTDRYSKVPKRMRD